MSKDFVKKVNELLVRNYSDKKLLIDGLFELKDPNVLAFFNTKDKKIYININCKYAFNDYVEFVETIFHETNHKINFYDKYIDVNQENKLHNLTFKNTYENNFKLIVSNVDRGLVDFSKKENEKVFKKLVLEKLENKELFNKLQNIFLKEIYKEIPQNEQIKYTCGAAVEQSTEQEENYEQEKNKTKNEYVFQEKDGIEI